MNYTLFVKKCFHTYFEVSLIKDRYLVIVLRVVVHHGEEDGAAHAEADVRQFGGVGLLQYMVDHCRGIVATHLCPAEIESF